MEAPLLRWVVLRGPAKLERNALNLRAEGLNLSSWAFFPPNLILNPGKHAKDKTLNLGAYLGRDVGGGGRSEAAAVSLTPNGCS